MSTYTLSTPEGRYAMRQPLPFCPFFVYRPFTAGWWGEVVDLPTAVCRRIRIIYQRARYGWSDWDVICGWDTHLSRTTAGVLHFMYTVKSGHPACFDEADWDRFLVKSRDALWAEVTTDYYEEHGNDYAAWNAHEQEVEAASTQAWRRIVRVRGGLYT